MSSEAEPFADEPQSSNGKRSLVQRGLDAVFGYDFFISYTRRDGGKDYAEALARRLGAAGFEIFFDSNDYAMGDDWKVEGKWALRRTSQLILVASPEALSSSAVVREVEVYSSLPNRRIIPIDFGGTIRNRDETKPIFKHLKSEILFIEENPDCLGSDPSDFVVQKIQDGFNLKRQDKKRSRVFSIVAAVLVVLTIAASAAAFYADNQRRKLAREIVTTLVGNVFLTSSADLSGVDFQKQIVDELADPDRRRESVLAEFDIRRAKFDDPRPADPSSQNDPILAGKQRADAAIVLLRLEAMEKAIDFLSCSPQDPEPISQFAARCKERGGVNQSMLIDFLELAYDGLKILRDPKSAQVDKIRRAELTCYGLILALGEFTDQPLPTDFIRTLEEWYADDPSSAIHGATGWLLRKSGEKAQTRVREIDKIIAVTAVENLADIEKEWFVLNSNLEVDGTTASIYLTFVVFQPGSFNIGSPEGEKDRKKNDERQTPVTIKYLFAVCDREVTNEQWKQFGGTPIRGSAEMPVHGVSREEINSVCNTLSSQISEPLRLQLPHEEEWEYACRGGTVTPFGFGSDIGLLKRFANPGTEKSLIEPGRLCPNTRGLFDMHGNANEWCGNKAYPYEKPEREGSAYTVRGGGIGMDDDSLRSAARNPDTGKHGFRLFLSPRRSP